MCQRNWVSPSFSLSFSPLLQRPAEEKGDCAIAKWVGEEEEKEGEGAKSLPRPLDLAVRRQVFGRSRRGNGKHIKRINKEEKVKSRDLQPGKEKEKREGGRGKVRTAERASEQTEGKKERERGRGNKTL